MDEKMPENVLPAPPTAEQTARMEKAVFGRIRSEVGRRRRLRRGVWMGAAAAVAVVALAAIVSPAVISGIGGASGSSGSDGSVPAVVGGAMPSVNEGGRSSDTLGSAGGSAVSDTGKTAADAGSSREIVATASLALTVDDPSALTDRIAELATAAGGYVESMSVNGATSSTGSDDAQYIPYGSDTWVQVRVPAAQLEAVLGQASGLGKVTSSSVNRSDVTDQAVDLRARVSAAQTSVDRLTQLMAQATSTADLIAAESALAERQATLESDQQQLTALESQVALSTLTVTLSKTPSAVTADPAGFGDGLAAGWNGLVATVNGIVVGLGFLLPWLVVAAVAVLVVWGIRRLRRARRAAGRAEAEPSAPAPAGVDRDRG